MRSALGRLMGRRSSLARERPPDARPSHGPGPHGTPRPRPLSRVQAAVRAGPRGPGAPGKEPLAAANGLLRAQGLATGKARARPEALRREAGTAVLWGQRWPGSDPAWPGSRGSGRAGEGVGKDSGPGASGQPATRGPCCPRPVTPTPISQMTRYRLAPSEPACPLRALHSPGPSWAHLASAGHITPRQQLAPSFVWSLLRRGLCGQL